MNIKTTIILLVLLLGVGSYLFFTNKNEPADVKPQVHTLLDVKAPDITRFVITGSDGKTIAAQKTTEGSAPAVWKLTAPVAATADNFKISSLLESLTDLKSTAEVSASGADAPRTGLDKPQYTVELYVNTKETKLAFGDKLTVSDGVYVQVGDKPAVDVVPASVLDSLDKPASDLRKTQLFETASPSVQQLSITRKDGSQLLLEKQTRGWQIVKPAPMPGDQSSIEDLISTFVNLTPVEFVDEPSLAMGFEKPTATVTFSAAAPSTQPTTQPVPITDGTTIVFGGYDDLEKKNIFARIPDGTIVKVAASVLDALNKKPLELRDKTVVDIEPLQVSRIIVAMNQPATTQPTTAPAVMKTTILERRKKEIGPMLPTTAPATTMASTRPATQPAVALSEWVIAGSKASVAADDAKVTTLLTQLHPLKADKFVEKPATKIVKQYTVTLIGPSTQNVITLTDPGSDLPLVGSYNGLLFELPRTIATDVAAEFTK
jgi:hypothetical protein